MDVVVYKYERPINDYGFLEYTYKIGIVPGGEVIKTFHVPFEYEGMDATERKVIAEINAYLKENGFNAVNKF